MQDFDEAMVNWAFFAGAKGRFPTRNDRLPLRDHTKWAALKKREPCRGRLIKRMHHIFFLCWTQ